MMAVGTCEGHLAQGVPVMGAYARAFRRNGLRCSGKVIKMVANDTHRTIAASSFGAEPTDATRLSFWQAWGITPQEQRQLEQHYDSWTLGAQFGETLLGTEAMDKAVEPLAPITLLVCPVN